MSSIMLLHPEEKHLRGYIRALKRGWSPDNLRPDASGDELAKIAADRIAFLQSLDDPEAKGGQVKLPDGSFVSRLPGFRRFIWDGDFCGIIGFRWQNKTNELPAHVLGHVGFSVVPWKQGKGYAKQALCAILPEARQKGLFYIELTTDCDNIASQKVITGCGGRLVERFELPGAFAQREGLRFRIDLGAAKNT